MANYDNQARYGTSVAQGQLSAIDEGLRAYMLRVYNYMTVGLVITGLAAYGIYSLSFSDVATGMEFRGVPVTAFGQMLFGTPLFWVALLAPLGLVFFLGARIGSMSVSAAQTTFWIFAALMGVSLSTIFVRFTGESITQVFMITAATFGAMSLYGYTTKRDISGWGSFLFMGLIGIILASLVNLWLGSPALHFAVSIIGVLVFTGFTAYDTQRIKEMYSVSDDGTATGRKAIMGALALYLDFINLFTMLLNLFGNRE